MLGFNTSNEVVFFGIGGVLCDYRPEARLAALRERSRLEPETVEAALDFLMRDINLGTYSARTSVEQLVTHLRLRAGYGELLEMWALAYPIRPDVVAIVEDLLAHGSRVGMLSNDGHLL